MNLSRILMRRCKSPLVNTYLPIFRAGLRITGIQSKYELFSDSSGKMNEEIFDHLKVKNDLSKFTGGRIYLDKTYWETGIAIMWLDYAEKRNAISGKMMVDLMSCVHELEKWKEGKAVLICGKGVNFCSGGDLNFVKVNSSPNNASNMSIWMMNALERLSNLDLVSVCLVHGPALGGGAEIPTFCDYILVGEDVKYGFVQGNMGIATAWGGGTKLMQKLGTRKALDLLLTSRILPAEECIKIGLADEVVSSKNILEDSLVWLKERFKHDYTIIRSFKRLANTSREEHGSSACLQIEKEITKDLWGGENHMKMINKFMKPTEK